ncbi:ABC transporter ATP-binding protein [Ignisphaera sp. 4213-co]|uniref:ABC transporter ATP-binding protein n=1 Tax=Ignisphaera cupida TaxID=3050454 RepID=A0ABD4Z662_9CREN|nr:ABC transporter ATP-binding protein [Ignisphaera sp. 4213-co]MDK6028113.1 ABC transporter ATP-binding protein [Ignisphaera sp. 4213-co]
MNPPAVVVKDLVKIYGRGSIGVDGISFTVESGEIYALIGPNGSGKTTTLRIIATLIKPTRGLVLVYGVNVVAEPLRVRSMISYLPEEAGAYRDLTGFDFVKFMLSLRFSGRRLEEAVEEAITIADLGNYLKKPIRTYSKGMKRILAVATVLASKPKLLILDEPTTGLDVEKSIYVRNLIKKYNKEYKITVLLSSHNMLEVEYLSHRVGMLYKGKLIAEGTPEQLKKSMNSSNLEEVFVKLKPSYDTIK